MTSNTGVHPKLPLKKIPGTGLNSNNEYDYPFVMDEEDKVKNNFEKIKKLVYHYEWIGRQQVNMQATSVAKKLNLAYGVIDVDDYIKDRTEYNVELTMMGGESLDYDLKFFPIIPNIINSLVSELSKQYINYQALAVNREATNQILEQKNNLIRQILLQPLQAQFDEQMSSQGIEQGTDIYQQQFQLFQQLPQVQEYFSKEYRLEVEQWANHQIQIDDRRFNMKDIEKQSMFNKLSTDLPYVHLNLLEGDYKPEVIDPRHGYYLRSPYTDDVSEGIMFGWFEYESPNNLITRFGDKLKEEDIEKLNTLHTYYRTLLTNDTRARYNLNTPGILESAQNFLAFKEIGQSHVQDFRFRKEEFKERLVQVSNMYLQVPRKLGKLTMRQGEEVFSTIVDDTYKVTYKPEYDLSYTKEKTEENLISGEHLEWFYINELWRCVKINLSVNPEPDHSNDIWLTLEKFPIQLADLGRKFGSYIPVHGGPKTNRYNNIVSIVDKCKPWQVFYNYLWNRNEQKKKSELGKILLLNQNIIPQESMGEEWGQHNFLKWALLARDMGLGLTDTSLSNTNQTNLGVSGGIGQMVDMTVVEEIIQNAKLAEICKNECLQIVGITPQFLGDISPSETATGVAQGVNRSVSQLKGLYDEHFSMFRRVRQTMLEMAKYLAFKNGGSVEQTYVNDQGQRIIFQVPADALIHQMGIYVTNSIDDNIVMENIKQYVLSDNTIGADVLDKVALVSSKSIGEVYDKLKEVNQDKERKERELQEREDQRQQQILQSQEKQLQAQLAETARQKELDRERDINVAEIRAIGQSQFSEGDGFEQLMRLKAEQDKQRNYYTDLVNKSIENTLSREQIQNQTDMNQRGQNEKLQLEKDKLQVQREKILADLKRSQNDVLIAKVNKNPKGSK